MGRKQPLEGRIELRRLEQVQQVLGGKGYLLGLANMFKSLPQKIILMLSELDPMIPIMLSLLIMRDNFSFDRQVVVLGSMLALTLIEEVV